MPQKTCTVDGIKYRAVHTKGGCGDCAASERMKDWNESLCGKLPDCFYPQEQPRHYISWIKVIPRKKNAATP